MVGVITWISLVTVVLSGLPSTARTPFMVHVTRRSKPVYVGLVPAGMFRFIGMTRFSPFVKCVGPESADFACK